MLPRKRLFWRSLSLSARLFWLSSVCLPFARAQARPRRAGAHRLDQLRAQARADSRLARLLALRDDLSGALALARGRSLALDPARVEPTLESSPEY